MRTVPLPTATVAVAAFSMPPPLAVPRMVLTAAPLMLSPPLARSQPAPLLVPPVQVTLPVTVRLAAPPRVPPDRVRELVVEGLAVSVIDSEPPETVSASWLFRLAIDVVPDENVT